MVIWIIAVVMVSVALAILLPPLFRQPKEGDVDRRAQNIAIAKEQLAQLEQDLADEKLAREEYEVAKEELEQALASNLEASVDAGVEVVDSPKSKMGLLMVGLFVPLFALGMYAVVGSPEMAGGKPPVAQAKSGSDKVDVEAMLATLRGKLEENPDNLKGWLMLGRSYMVMERFPLAVEAYKKANALSPDQPEIMLPLADAVAMTNGGRLQGEAKALIDRVLELEPENAMGLWLSGMASRQANDNDAALAAWQKLYGLLPAGSADQEEVGRLIAELGGDTPAVAAKSPAAGAGGITVTVGVPDEIRAQVKDTDLVFIYAKAMQGPPMPLAAVRKQVKDLPITITLDDSMAMMPQMKLSGFDRVKVGARISKGGGPIAQSGDVFAEQQNVQAGDKVELSIRQLVP